MVGSSVVSSARSTILFASLVNVVVADDTTSLLQTRFNRDESVDAAYKERLSELTRPPFRQYLTNFGDSQYVADISLGNQRITGILDTGSFDMVVFGSDCKGCGMAAHYLPEFSRTFRSGMLTKRLRYGSGDATCENAFDMVSIGDFEPRNQSFWNVLEAEMSVLSHAGFESIIGIGPVQTEALQHWSRIKRYVDKAESGVKQGRWPAASSLSKLEEETAAGLLESSNPPILSTIGCKVFSLCNGFKPGSNGVVVWNDDLAFRYPKWFRRVPTIREKPDLYSWSANLTDFSIDFQGGERLNVCQEGCIGLIDSGTSLLTVPTAVADWMQGQLEKRVDPDCGNLHELPSLAFKLGGMTFTLPPDAYIAQVNSETPVYKDASGMNNMDYTFKQLSTNCHLTVLASNRNDRIILGMPFLRSYYTTFYLGKEEADRAFFIAPVAPDSECQPVTEVMGSTLQVRNASKPPVRRLLKSRLMSTRVLLEGKPTIKPTIKRRL